MVAPDRTNARHLSAEALPEPGGLAVMDVSFISARTILGALATAPRPGADAVVLVKPQFEVGRTQVGRGGLVKDEELHRQALRDVAKAAQGLGFGVRGACASPVTGRKGNREVLRAPRRRRRRCPTRSWRP